MKVVFYEEGDILSTLEGVTPLVVGEGELLFVDADSVQTHLTGFTSKVAILPDGFEGEGLEEMMAADESHTFQKQEVDEVTMLKAQIKASDDRADFQEEVITEIILAMYAG